MGTMMMTATGEEHAHRHAGPPFSPNVPVSKYEAAWPADLPTGNVMSFPVKSLNLREAVHLGLVPPVRGGNRYGATEVPNR